MELTRALVEEMAREYSEVEPLYAVEQEHVELLRETFASEDYGWRDVEWVVQWYFRRHLGAYPDDERRATEEAFRDNDFEAVVETLAAVVEDRETADSDEGDRETADSDEGDRETADRLDRLTALAGVDVRVASAFLLFAFPERYAPVGRREWSVLREADELDRPYPDSPDAADYLAYDEVCRELTDRFEVEAWTLYRALWRLSEGLEE